MEQGFYRALYLDFSSTEAGDRVKMTETSLLINNIMPD